MYFQYTIYPTPEKETDHPSRRGPKVGWYLWSSGNAATRTLISGAPNTMMWEFWDMIKDTNQATEFRNEVNKLGLATYLHAPTQETTGVATQNSKEEFTLRWYANNKNGLLGIAKFYRFEDALVVSLLLEDARSFALNLPDGACTAIHHSDGSLRRAKPMQNNRIVRSMSHGAGDADFPSF